MKVTYCDLESINTLLDKMESSRRLTAEGEMQIWSH